MSSYLLAFTVSDFDYVSNEAFRQPGEILHRVWVQPNSTEKAQYALENSVKVLNALEDYVGFKCELDKVDSSGVPGRNDAMENWGLVRDLS